MLPGLSLLLFVLFGMFVIAPLVILTRQDSGQTHAGGVVTPPTAVPAVVSDQIGASEAGYQVLAAAKAQLQQRHPDSRFESFRANYCAGDYAVATFLVDGRSSAAYLMKQDGVWKVVIEGANPTDAEVRAKGLPESIAKYPPPCLVRPRGA